MAKSSIPQSSSLPKVPVVIENNKVETKLGPIFITPTDSNHFHVCSRDGNASRDVHSGFLALRGCDYYVSAHYYRWHDEAFHLGYEFKESDDSNGKRTVPTNTYERRQSLYISNRAASESAHTKIEEVLNAAVNEWATANPDIIEAANLNDLTSKVESAEADVNTAKEALAKAQAALKIAEENLRTAKKAVR
jgi:hypothetical protein